MGLKNEMVNVLIKRKSLNMNDDFGIQKCWTEMTKILTQNADETINYFNECNEDDLYYISEVFEDIAEKLQSEKFINCLRKLDKKFPGLEMTKDINIAESYIKY
ncbi:hypothetical protein [Listeria seeligeri]|uniref:hypothetical protein n=1 Tax=Listeria seeligeri TaxID=1640 RepID=UPI001886FD27|nr:hypothetical protein [Listeria seeligeri]MBF2453566.1 hypothetical protein [Listeria seeligeri]MBF2669253.1 hypothetical protein [Listeria seeligeri]